MDTSLMPVEGTFREKILNDSDAQEVRAHSLRSLISKRFYDVQAALDDLIKISYHIRRFDIHNSKMEDHFDVFHFFAISSLVFSIRLQDILDLLSYLDAINLDRAEVGTSKKLISIVAEAAATALGMPKDSSEHFEDKVIQYASRLSRDRYENLISRIKLLRENNDEFSSSLHAYSFSTDLPKKANDLIENVVQAPDVHRSFPKWADRDKSKYSDKHSAFQFIADFHPDIRTTGGLNERDPSLYTAYRRSMKERKNLIAEGKEVTPFPEGFKPLLDKGAEIATRERLSPEERRNARRMLAQDQRTQERQKGKDR